MSTVIYRGAVDNAARKREVFYVGETVTAWVGYGSLLPSLDSDEAVAAMAADQAEAPAGWRLEYLGAESYGFGFKRAFRWRLTRAADAATTNLDLLLIALETWTRAGASYVVTEKVIRENDKGTHVEAPGPTEGCLDWNPWDDKPCSSPSDVLEDVGGAVGDIANSGALKWIVLGIVALVGLLLVLRFA